MTDSINVLQKTRKEKLSALRSISNPYTNTFKPKNLNIDIIAAYSDVDKESLAANKVEVTIAGRIMLQRLMGKASFVQLQDSSAKIQIYVRQDELGETKYHEFCHLDLGDIIGVSGYLFKTKTNELSVWVTNLELVTKSLRALPDKWHGLADKEICYRQRYVDLIVNEDSRKVFLTRSKIIQEMRRFFLSHDYMEVETPMMHVIPGGATARPFVTHHNALNMELYLRIAPELYLKRLVVGGFERVFEINRNFRNEGVSTRHNPEFTMIEFYQAYADYIDMMDLTEELFRNIAIALNGTTLHMYQGHEYDLSKPFTRLTLAESIVEYNADLDTETANSAAKLQNYLLKHNISLPQDHSLGSLQLALFDATVESKLIMPTFITAYPTVVSPLARQNDQEPSITDRFELFICGREIANGFSELNDPEDQAERFKDQVAAKENGDLEAMHYDADYIRALEYGMPPTAGQGIGVDRLVMFFTNANSIKDVILFPHLKMEENIS